MVHAKPHEFVHIIVSRLHVLCGSTYVAYCTTNKSRYPEVLAGGKIQSFLLNVDLLNKIALGCTVSPGRLERYLTGPKATLVSLSPHHGTSRLTGKRDQKVTNRSIYLRFQVVEGLDWLLDNTGVGVLFLYLKA